jgi:hypothetical protein
MESLSLNEWIEQLRARFDQRTLSYMSVHKAKIALQLKDKETGEIHLHQLDYESKDAEHLRIASVGR